VISSIEYAWHVKLEAIGGVTYYRPTNCLRIYILWNLTPHVIIFAEELNYVRSDLAWIKYIPITCSQGKT
jgi:hypothetical protein